MKRLFYVLLVAILVVSCKTTPKKVRNYVMFSGKITNQKSDSLSILSRMGYHKKIKLNTDGTFKDTLKVKAGNYVLFHGEEATYLFLKNGDDLKMTLDTKKFDKTVVYTGIGSAENNYLAKQLLSQENLSGDASLFELDKSQFEKKANGKFTAMRKSLDSVASKLSLDSSFVASQKAGLERSKKGFFARYDQKHYLATVLAKGKPSPKFMDYENYKGGKTSLKDFEGKYVYIDVWATWCGPCKAQIPFLKKIEEKYSGKNIVFISLSIDKKVQYSNWKKMIVDKKMGGIQLIADKDWKSEFVQDYKINGIPRFILIDPKGNIVNSDAPRPSETVLTTLLDSLPL